MRSKVAAITLGILGVIGIGVWLWTTSFLQEGKQPESSETFKLVEVADKALDGAPAIALTFSLPLDSNKRYDRYIQVFEMPNSQQEGSKASDPSLNSDVEEVENEDSDFAPHTGKSTGYSVSTSSKDTDTQNGKAISGAWVVGENPRLLYFPHIKPQTRYVVHIKLGLPDKSGMQLTSESRYSIVSAPVSPAYYFASNGIVLPAKQNGGLPVVTVNIPEVDIQFLRVKNDQLPRFLDRVIAGPRHKAKNEAAQEDEESGHENYDWRHSSLRGAVSNYQLDDLRNLTESVFLGRFSTEQRPNRRSVTYISVEQISELKEPGVYVAVMSQPGRFRYEYQTTYFYVSDLGLHVRQYDKSADVFISSLIDGKSVKEVEVSWLDAQGKVLARAESDGEGHATFAERPKGAKVVLARKHKQVSMVALKEPALDLSEYDITGDPFKPVRLFAYSGRNLYRPGESFDLSVLARDSDGRPVPTQPIQAVLKRPDGRSQFTANWRPDERFAGYYLKKIELPADAPTGFWMLELRNDPADKVPGTIFKFGVEEFLPERIKIDLNTVNKELTSNDVFTIDISSNHLYGAPAVGNRLLGVAQFERNKNPLTKQFPGFEFGDVAENEIKSRKELEEKQADTEGHAQMEVDLSSLAKRRSPFTVRATISLLESGGRPVVRSIERVVWPASTLIGIRPLFSGDNARENSAVDFEVVRVDRVGNIKPMSALPVRLFRENREYYWRFEDQRGWHSGFTETDELVETVNVAVPSSARGKLRLPVRYGRYRVEIDDPETGLKMGYRFYAGWSARSDEAQGVRPDRVALKLDKVGYQEGDTARLTITPPHQGEALVTVEGDRVLWFKRFPISQSGGTVDIPFSREWKRHDLYVSVMVLRPGNEGDRVTPARALGIIHLPLERTDRKLAVTLEAPSKVRPETVVKVKVRAPEAKGQKAFVTLSAVDVGILNITRYTSPDPHGFFFGKLRYAADQRDVYGRLIEKMHGQKGKLKFGGDNIPKQTNSLPKKVKLVDLFSGPILLDERGEAEVPLALPDFNGTLRLMAVVSAADRFGAKESEMTVASPMIAELAAARFLSFGDNAIIALDLHNLSGATKELKVTLDGGKGVQIHEGGRSLVLKHNERRTLRFPAEARAIAGLHNVTVKVIGQDIRLDRTFPLTVQAATPLQHFSRRYVIKPGESLAIRDADLSGLHKGSMLAHLAISDKSPIDVRSAVQGLLTYPYGCAEQTTSTAYPHVFIDEEAAQKFGLKIYSREKRAEMLEHAIARISAMQAPNGGFSLWGNMSEYEYWLSAYITAFLQDAREQGFAVPETMMSKAKDFLLRGLQDGVSRLPITPAGSENTGNTWDANPTSYNSRFGVLAYGAYILARENKVSLATLRQLYESRSHAHSGLGLIHLGLALKIMGDPSRSATAIDEGLRKTRDTAYWWGDYGSPLRDAAMSYLLLEKHKVTGISRDNLINTIVNELNGSRYYSTQEKMALFLMGRSYGNEEMGQWSAELHAGDKPEAMASKGTRFREIHPAELSAGMKVINTYKHNLYAELSLSGNPIKLPAAKNNPIELSRAMFAPDGNAIGARPLKVGETVIVRIIARSNIVIGTGMVVDKIPAGLEIENLNIVQGEQMGAVTIGGINPAQAMTNARIKHVEFRDDRFVAAVRLDSNPITLFYRARVVTPGQFVVPALYAEDMYRPDVFGMAGGNEILSIVDAKTPEKAAEGIKPVIANKEEIKNKERTKFIVEKPENLKSDKAADTAKQAGSR